MSETPSPIPYEGPMHGPFALPIPEVDPGVEHRVYQEVGGDPVAYQLHMQIESLEQDRMGLKINEAEYQLLRKNVQDALDDELDRKHFGLRTRARGLDRIAEIRQNTPGIPPKGKGR